MKDNPFDPQNNLWKITNPAQETINEALSPMMARFYDDHFEQNRGVYTDILENFDPARLLGTDFSPAFDFEHVTSGLSEEMRDMIYGLGASGVSVSGMMDKWEGTAASVASQAIRGIDFSGLAKSAGYRVPDVLAQLSAGARMDALAEEISKIVSGQQDIYASVFQKLERTLDFYQPSTLEKAKTLAEANPEVSEAVDELIEEHPEQARDLATKVAQGVPPKLFPNTPSEYIRAVSPGATGIFNITQASFTGMYGDLFVYIILGTILLVAFDAAGIILKDLEESRVAEEVPEEE